MAEAIYGMNYSNFIGVDKSSDPRVVARNRLAHSVNMWRDYESEQGAAVETFPGFRRVVNRHGESDIGFQGFWYYKGSKYEYLLVHQNIYLDAYKINDLVKETEQNAQGKTVFEKMNQFDSTAFAINNRFYIINGSSGDASPQMIVVYEENGEITAEKVEEYYEENGESTAKKVEEYYVPTTYYNGKPYEQRNAFSGRVIQIDSAGGVTEEYKGPNESDPIAEHVAIPLYEPYDYQKGNITVIVDGKKFVKDETGYGYIASKKYKIASDIYVGDERRNTHTLYFNKSDLYKNAIWKTVKIEYTVYDTYFNPIGNLVRFQNDKLTMADAILGCTKSAVYDGRVFLTGNPDLPNTVFYSHRNLTGANDPTYFGVYNYFNDGDGNTPNVDLLAMPNMLMVMKSDTVQDGSVYYHVGTDNPHSDESVRNLAPRVYPATKGAAGLGSAGDTTAHSISCNFLDDPVFLSRRGLEAIGKQTVNLERTMVHRSSNVDRLLRKEDLAHASIAEWKGYLVICCNGHIYLADSRTLAQHPDGSVQYEWFYLEGVGTYDKYDNKYSLMTGYPLVSVATGVDENLEGNEWEDVDLSEFEVNGTKVKYGFELSPAGYDVSSDLVLVATAVYRDAVIPKYIDIYYVEKGERRYLVNPLEEKQGKGKFYGAKRVIAIGERLFFATDFDICIFNTDKRGEQIYLKDDSGKDVFDEEGKRILVREVDSDKIDSSWYSFNGVPYISGCSIRLDDCEKKTVTKANVYGTTVARFKMIPGSKCTVKSSINGVNWKKIGEAFISRLNFEDFRFDNVAFTENEDGVFVFPEASRGWVSKQYYFYSDGFCEPFGLYELSYNYKIVGKIRR